MEDNTLTICRGTNLSFLNSNLPDLCQLFEAADPDDGFVALSFITQIKKESAYRYLDYDNFLELTESMGYFIDKHICYKPVNKRPEYIKLKRSGMSYCKAFKKFYGYRMLIQKHFYGTVSK